MKRCSTAAAPTLWFFYLNVDLLKDTGYVFACFQVAHSFTTNNFFYILKRDDWAQQISTLNKQICFLTCTRTLSITVQSGDINTLIIQFSLLRSVYVITY